MPDRNTPYQPQVSPPVLADAGNGGLGTSPIGSSGAQTPTPPDLSTQSPASPPVATAPVQRPETPPTPPAVTPPKPAVTPPPKPQPQPPRQRDDDGARALALLEGRSPSDTPAAVAPKPAAKGNFVLQIASYGAQADAQSRRTTLHQAGVTNAFVEPANIGGKQQYRLRVGPFPSREAAQAAQARLRTLGYDNGFIATQ